MPYPSSFILCSIPVSYPKRRIFDMFQQKKICIVESIEFIFTDDEHLCHASIYIAKWYQGKLCENFLKQLRTKHFVHFVDGNHYVWKIIPTPTIVQRNTSPKWFQKKVSSGQSENPVVKIKSKPNTISVGSDLSDISDDDTGVSDDDDDAIDYNSDDSDIDSLITEIDFES